MKKILLIEDDPDQVELYSAKFQMEGLDIITAGDGRLGLALAAKDRPDLILLDIVMDDMDGLEVLRRLKQDKKTANIPVVLLTNLIKKNLIKESRELGAVGFWSKTEIMPQQIVDRIRKILKIKK
ncbi:MAG TPA: response regulator [Patescibacteria group bacterium]|nr:response regulator [Patescibacteria group bacterium]